MANLRRHPARAFIHERHRTESAIPDNPKELSFYSTEGYYVGPCHLRRYTLRQDGFVSVHAGGKKGEWTSKPIIFEDDPTLISKSTKSPKVELTKKSIDGQQSLHINRAMTMTLPKTQSLGKQATFSALLRDVPRGQRRLFSAYNGGGVPSTQGEMWIDFDAKGTGIGLRFGGEGELIEADQAKLKNWSKNQGDKEAHLITATWDDGIVNLYFDGKLVGEGGTPSRGALNFKHGDVLFAEYYGPTPRGNEPFIGTVDNLMILKRALSETEIATLYSKGIKTVKGKDDDLLIDFEKIDGGAAINAYNSKIFARIPEHQGPSDTVPSLNFSTSAAGSIRCEIQNEDGTPIPGFSLKDFDEIYGDSLDQTVSWGEHTELNSLVGKPIRLHIVMQDADLYALQFR